MSLVAMVPVVVVSRWTAAEEAVYKVVLRQGRRRWWRRPPPRRDHYGILDTTPTRSPARSPPSSSTTMASPSPCFEKITTLVKAANIKVEAYWPGLFAKLLEHHSVDDLILSVGSRSHDGVIRWRWNERIFLTLRRIRLV